MVNSSRLLRLLVLGFCAVFFLNPGAKGQQACFQFVGDSVGCAPFTVKVRSCADVGSIVSFYFEWFEGSTDYIIMPPGVTDTSYTYNTPGTYIVYQLRGGANFQKRTVKVYSQEARPSFTWTSCRDTLAIQFSDSVFSGFRFLPGDGNTPQMVNGGQTLYRYRYNFTGTKATYFFDVQGRIPSTCSQAGVRDTVTLYKLYQPPQADSLVGIDTLTYRTSLRTRADEPYFIQEKEGNVWVNKVIGMTPNDNPNRKDQFSRGENGQPFYVRSLTKSGCNDSLLAPEWEGIWPRTFPENQRITISWPKINPTDVAQFELWRNGIRLKVISNLADTLFVDTAGLLCGQNYCYQILIRKSVAGYAGQMVYLSAPICTQARSNIAPGALENLTATVKTNGIEINGKMPSQARSYILMRKEKEGEEFSKLLESNKLPILDTDADFNNRAYCYKIQYQDKCDNFSMVSDSVCPVWLRVEELSDARFQFVWTRMEGWKGGLERYELLRTTPQDSPILMQMAKNQSYLMNGRDKTRQHVYYTIRSYANEKDLYPMSSSNTVEIIQKSKFRFPEVFTPNDDRMNDFFTCAGIFVTEFEMTIYNPWGEVVYYSDRINEGWNGKIDSKPAPTGVYAYKAKGKDMEGNDLESSGYFTLMR